MLINGKPIELYGAKQLTVDFSPSQQSTTYEWNAGARLPILIDAYATFKSTTILLKVTGANRQEAVKNASIIHGLAAGSAEYELDGYPGWLLCGVLESAPDLKKTVEKSVYKLTLKVQGYLRSKEQKSAEANRTTMGHVYVEGTRDTPITLEVTPVIDMLEFSIYGVAERGITIKNLSKGITIYIDSATGLVTENGKNKFDDVIMFEFPHLEPGSQEITFSESTCNVTIKYYPMWR